MVFSSNNVGVQVREISQGALLSRNQNHAIAYMFGSAGSGTDDTRDTFVNVTSTLDFATRFGIDSPSYQYVRLLFLQDVQNQASVSLPLQFCAITSHKRESLTIDDPLDDLAAHTFTITDGSSINESFTYTPDAAGNLDTVTTVRDALLNAINSRASLSGLVEATPDASDVSVLYIKSVDYVNTPVTITPTTANVTLATVANGDVATVSDYTETIIKLLGTDEGLPSGFLICPEAFKDFTSASDRAILISILETACDASNCLYLIDPPETMTEINDLITERKLYGSPKGHGSIFAPWCTTTDGTQEITIPPSPIVAGIWIHYIKNRGIKKPPFGTQKIIAGITKINVNYGNADTELANLDNVNLLRNIPAAGNVIWGGRTLSTNSLYLFGTARVIMNLINQDAYEAFLPFIGRAIDIQGGIFHDLKNTGNQILYRRWSQGALYGSTPNEAFKVVCDESNNPSADIQQGSVKVDLYASLTPSLERVLVTSVVVPINSLG